MSGKIKGNVARVWGPYASHMTAATMETKASKRGHFSGRN